MAKTDKQKSFNWSLWIRILAIILAALLIGEIILSNVLSVKFSKTDYEGTNQEQAAQIVESNDSYLSGDDLQRMRAVIATLGEPKTFDQYSLFCSVAIADQDYNKAIDYLAKSIELFEGSSEELSKLYVKLGCLYALDSNWTDALTFIQKGLEIDNNNTDGQLMLCEAYLNLQDYENALEALTVYSKNSTLTSSQLDAMIQLQLSLGKYDEVITSCNEALKSPDFNKGDIEVYMAQAYLSLDDIDSARDYAQKGIADGGDKTQANLILAACSEADGDIQSAFNKTAEIVESGNANFTVYNLLCQYAYSLGDYDNLIKYSEKALSELYVESEKIVFNKWLGVGQLEKNQYEESEKNLSKYLEYDSSIIEVFYLRGLCYMALNSFDKAEADFTTAMASEELHDECLYNRALCRIKLNKNSDAAEDFVTIIKRDSDSNVVEQTVKLLSLNEKTIKEIRENDEYTLNIG